MKDVEHGCVEPSTARRSGVSVSMGSIASLSKGQPTTLCVAASVEAEGQKNTFALLTRQAPSSSTYYH